MFGKMGDLVGYRWRGAFIRDGVFSAFLPPPPDKISSPPYLSRSAMAAKKCQCRQDELKANRWTSHYKGKGNFLADDRVFKISDR